MGAAAEARGRSPALGSHPGDDRVGVPESGTLSSGPVAQVVPDIPTFSVDDGFAYRVPEDLAGKLQVGSLVRVPLSGRRVRGYVVDVRSGERERLKDVLSISGDLPVFDERILETLRWAAIHYVAPLASVLAKTAPPNLPRLALLGDTEKAPAAPGSFHRRPRYQLSRPDWGRTVRDAAGPALSAGTGVLVVAPTVVEARRLLAAFDDDESPAVLATSALSARAATSAWVRAAAGPGTVLVGTREVALWPMARLGAAVVVDEGRRGMKDKQTPTTHVREILRRRALVERFALSFVGSVPTAEALASGIEVAPAPRLWPQVEVVDRRDDPPGSGIITDRGRRALRAVLKGGGSAFVFSHRRGYAPAFRCVRCRSLRQCPECGASPGREESCARCGALVGACPVCGGRRFEPLGAGVGRIIDELRRALGPIVGPAGTGARVVVGTERDLVAQDPVELSIVADAEGLLLAPHYRAEEDALRLMVRVAQLVDGRGSRRSVVQTALPDHPVMGALKRGNPISFLRTVLRRRRDEGFPPTGELLALETEGGPSSIDEDLRNLVAERGTVLGPAERRGRQRWLVQGADLRGVRVGLRGLVQGWREAGGRVRVDADPIDL